MTEMPEINFRSDNVATVSPEILQALAAANSGPAASYGDDAQSAALNRSFSALFEADVTVFPVSTGTAANALSLAACVKPYGGILCHEHAHIHTAEGGATEAFTGGAKLIPLPGEQYRLTADTLGRAVSRIEWGVRNKPQPDALSITQASEHGTVYRLDELAALGDIAHGAGLKFHMDGARFANALAALGCTPADMSWRRGVDILSFGATKNGAMNTEAIVVFDPSLVEPLSYRLRKAGQTWSKMRFAATQLLAYVEDGLYLRLAARSNGLATRLAQALAALPGVSLMAPVEANLIFLSLPPAMIDAMIAGGARVARRSDSVIRLVTRFDGREEDIDRLIEIAERASRN
ncbi:MAG TPA: beta-eliminating lyase-related protein [Aliidongia sp.]|uniref:threonine aldolase family protein n=1 Tax=Aliidongia sp. TaxID=1914230 RepID=UPI002DDCD36D|nr:beta-eliminating lyase-related protein [Aliidongia sp.]HEV2674779.1 beta-eliminating lyase-related protein [Aliidongia sp.]